MASWIPHSRRPTRTIARREPHAQVGSQLTKKICAPRSIVFSPRLARARVSLSCESDCRAHAGAVCVNMLPSCVRRRSLSYPGITCVGNKPGCSTSGLSANQRRLNKILSSWTVAKIPGGYRSVGAHPQWTELVVVLGKLPLIPSSSRRGSKRTVSAPSCASPPFTATPHLTRCHVCL